MMKFMTEEEKAKREKAFQEVLKGIEVATTNESDKFYNVPGSSKYKYRRGLLNWSMQTKHNKVVHEDDSCFWGNDMTGLR